MSSKKFSLPKGYTLLQDDEIDNIYYIAIETATKTRASEQCPSCLSDVLVGNGRNNFSTIDLPYNNQPVRLEIKRRRYRCRYCGNSYLEELPEIDQKHRITNRAIEYIKKHVLSESFQDIAKTFSVDEKTIRNIYHSSIIQAKQYFDTPKIIGIYDVKIHKGSRKIITNVEHNTIINILPDGDAENLKVYFAKFKERQEIKYFVLHSQNEYVYNIVEQAFPHAKINVDGISLLIDEYIVFLTIFYETLKDVLSQKYMERIMDLADNALQYDVKELYKLDIELARIINEYKTRFPIIEHAYSTHKFFNNLCNDPKHNDISQYALWLEKINKLGEYTSKYDNLVHKIKNIINGTTKLDPALHNVKNDILEVQQLESNMKLLLKYGYIVDNLWQALLIDDADLHSRGLKHILKIKATYQKYCTAPNFKNHEKGIYIKALINAIRENNISGILRQL